MVQPQPNQAPASAAVSLEDPEHPEREAGGLRCPLGDSQLCRLLDSIEQAAAGRILQTTCMTCGSGCARRLDVHEQPVLRKWSDYEPPPVPPVAEAVADVPPAADLAAARSVKPPRIRKERDRLDLPAGEP
jgi:hypothetical protein